MCRAQLTHFTPEDGVAQSTIYSILEDKYGLIWISTASGVSRYDGSGFMEVPVVKNAYKKPNAPQGILHSDSLGDIWVGGIPGLYRSHGGTNGFENMVELNGDSALANSAVFCATDSQVWFSGVNTYIQEYNVHKKQIANIDLKQFTSQWETVYSCAISKSSFICITHKAIYFLNRKLNVLKRRIPLESRNITKALELFPGVWIFTFLDRPPLYVNESSTEVSHHMVKELDEIGPMNLIYRKGKDLFVADIKNRVYHFQIEKARKLVPVYDWQNEPGAFGRLQIVSMELDRNNQLWVGTDGSGLYKLNVSKHVFGHTGSLTTKGLGVRSGFVRSFLEDDLGRLWVGTYQGGVQLYDRDFRAIKATGLLSRLNTTSVTAMFKDSRGRIWLGTDAGVFYTNDQIGNLTLTKVKKRTDDIEVSINNFDESGSGVIRCASNVGVFEFNEESKTWNCITGCGGSSLVVFTDADGRVWSSGYWTYLRIFDQQGLTPTTKAWKQLFPAWNTRHVVFDPLRQIYIVATENGLRILDKDLKEKNHFGIKDGLSDLFVYGTLIDQKGNYWISTNIGINCIDPNTRKVLRFSTPDGLQSREFNSGAFIKLKSGFFVFGGINGFNYFRPEQVLAAKQHNQIVLTNAVFTSENGEKMQYSGLGMTLPTGWNFVDVSYTLPDFSNPTAIRYFYRLNTNQWVSLGNKNRIFLSNLEPGKYMLYVKAEDQNGRPVEEVLLAKFTMLAPFYKTWWFFVLMVLFAGVLVFAITRYLYVQRLKVALAEAHRVKEIHSLRLNISRELHDNLGASLSRVSLLTHKLREMPEKTDLQTAVASISQLAAEMNGQVRNIVWSIDNSYDNLESLRTYMRQFASVFLEENDMEYSIRFNDIHPELVIGPDIRQALFSVLKETLNNAVKHSGSKKMDIDFITREDGNFKLRMCDYGTGFRADHKKPFSHGLRNIRSRLEELGFACTIRSAPGEGCEIGISGRFQIPH